MSEYPSTVLMVSEECKASTEGAQQRGLADGTQSKAAVDEKKTSQQTGGKEVAAAVAAD